MEGDFDMKGNVKQVMDNQLQVDNLLKQLNLGVNPTLKTIQDDMVRILTDFYRDSETAKNIGCTEEERKQAQTFANSSYSKAQSILDIVSVYSDQSAASKLARKLPDILVPLEDEETVLLSIMGKTLSLPRSDRASGSTIAGYANVSANVYYAFYTILVRQLLKKEDERANQQMECEPLTQNDFVTFTKNLPLMKKVARISALWPKEDEHVSDDTFQKSLGTKIG